MAVSAGPTAVDLADLVADKGYHLCAGLKELKEGAWKSRIAERKVRGVHRWYGDKEARRAVYNNCARLRRRRQGGVHAPGRVGRAQLCPHPRSWRHASCLAARRRLRSRPDHGASGRRRHTTGADGLDGRAPARHHHCRWGYPRHLHPRCRHRNGNACREHRARAAGPIADVVNGLQKDATQPEGTNPCNLSFSC